MSGPTVATQPALLSVQPVCEEVVVRRWRSQVRPELVVTDGRYDLPVLRWADAYPHVYKIASGTRSRVFGRNSCAHIGWAQRSKAPAAVFERADDASAASNKMPRTSAVLSPLHLRSRALSSVAASAHHPMSRSSNASKTLAHVHRS